MSAPSRHGFTLIELSIVLVIIGLIVGGVMAGKALIQQAEIRAAASQLQQMETAYNAFRLKYNCIVGDCPNATDFFGMNYVVVAAGCPPSGGAGNGNGNGDGFIDKSSGLTSDGTWTCEPVQAAQSLSLSGLLSPDISAPCRNYPEYFKGINTSCAFFYKDDIQQSYAPIYVNSVAWGVIPPDGFSPYGAALSPMQARLIDEKLDDGKPNTGKFRGLDAARPTGGGIIVGSCSTSQQPTGAYNVNEDYTCRSLYYFK